MINEALLVGGAVVAIRHYVLWSRYNDPAYLACLPTLNKVKLAAGLAYYSTHSLLHHGLLGSQISTALHYCQYFSAVQELEKQKELCKAFMKEAELQELFARVVSVKSVLAYAAGPPQVEVFKQIELAVNNPGDNARHTFYGFIVELEKCSRAFSDAKLKVLHGHFFAMLDLLDSEYAYNVRSLAAAGGNARHTFRPNRTGKVWLKVGADVAFVLGVSWTFCWLKQRVRTRNIST